MVVVRLLTLLSLLLAAPLASRAAETFAHPGLLHSAADLARIRAALAAREEPILSGFAALRADRFSDPRQPQRTPHAEIGRNPAVNQAEFDADATAAYQLALVWALTGDQACADRARAIVTGWSATLQRVTGADAVLMAGLGPFKLINAAELLRHTASGWTPADSAATEAMLRRVIVPALRDFAPFANGNWDTAAIKTLAAVAVFCDDRALFAHALRYAVAGHGNGRITHYILDATGQCQESGRDVGHTLLGLGHLADTAEIAWHQGLDLYAHADHRILAGFEYAARYNLGDDVPFAATVDRTGKYRHAAISARGRGQLRPLFEQVHHHYVHRAGVPAPWTARAAAKLRPEAASRPHYDHGGFGTLLFTRPGPDAPTSAAGLVAPAALHAVHRAGAIVLGWIRPRGAVAFRITRHLAGQPPAVLAAQHLATEFTDRDAPPGALCRYEVHALRSDGVASPSASLAVHAGLPRGGVATDLGAPALPGHATHDETRLTLEGAGPGFLGSNDAAHLASWPGLTRLAARYVPQVSSQVGQFGLVARADDTPGSVSAALLVLPEPSRSSERPSWSVHLIVRATAGAAAHSIQALPLPAAFTPYGRLTAPLWLRLARTPTGVAAAVSFDGVAWQEIASAPLVLPPSAHLGLAVASGIPTRTSTVTFDQLTVTP